MSPGDVLSSLFGSIGDTASGYECLERVWWANARLLVLIQPIDARGTQAGLSEKLIQSRDNIYVG